MCYIVYKQNVTDKNATKQFEKSLSIRTGYTLNMEFDSGIWNIPEFDAKIMEWPYFYKDHKFSEFVLLPKLWCAQFKKRL